MITYDDLNSTLGDLGGDVKSLEETGLLRTHTGVLCLDNDVNRGKSSSSSRGSYLKVICVNGVSQFV